jgi:hypothetical protein
VLLSAVTSKAAGPVSRRAALQVARKGDHGVAQPVDAVLVHMAQRPVPVAQRLQFGRVQA